jgi:hypothetical protein
MSIARIAGVFYLLVGIFGGFAEGFVDPKLYVAGNATATAANVVANADLVRMGVVAHLVDGVFFALTAMALYLLLHRVQKNAARLMVLFVALAVGMICLMLSSCSRACRSLPILHTRQPSGPPDRAHS